MKMKTFSKHQLLILNEFAAFYDSRRILGVGLVSDGLMKVICFEPDRKHIVFYEYYNRDGELVKDEFDYLDDYKKKI